MEIVRPKMKNGILLILTLFALLSPCLKSHACDNTIEISMTSYSTHLEVNYQVPQTTKKITLMAPASLSQAFPNANTASNSKHVTLVPDENGDFATEVHSLGKFINAVYIPYINLSNGYGIYTDYITPVEVLFESGQIKEVDKRCVHYWINTGGSKVAFTPKETFSIIGPKQENNDQKIRFYYSENLPKWIHQAVTEDFTSFFNFYSEKLDAKPVEKLNVLVSFEDAEYPFFDGGVHDNNTFVLRFGGTPYQKYDPLARLSIAKFIAHEVFHTWSLDSNKTTPWIHEGAADYAALVALQSLKAIPPEKFSTINNENILNCLFKYSSEKLPNSHQWRGRYSCGSAFINHSIGASQFFNFWRQVIKHNDTTTDIEVFSKYLNAQEKRALIALTHPPYSAAQSTQNFSQLTGTYTLDTSISDSMLKGLLFNNLMRGACKGIVSFNSFDDGSIELYPQTACSATFPQKTMRITKINSLSIYTEASILFRSYLDGCNSNNQVKVEGDGYAQKLFCTVPPVTNL